MTLSNLERLIKLATEVFDVKSDPRQLDVNPEVLARLKKMHPATISEYNEGDGPIAWVLLIPTTQELMDQFVAGQITEKELFELTPVGGAYEAVYLCSALILEEYRRKGITKNLAVRAIEKIRKKHQLKAAFAWAFSAEGDKTAESIARHCNLPLFKREK